MLSLPAFQKGRPRGLSFQKITAKKAGRVYYVPSYFYDMKKILINENAGDECLRSLEQYGYMPVALPPFDKLSAPIASHADMLIYALTSGELLTYRGYYETNKAMFDGLGRRISVTDDPVSPEYPDDIPLNALRLGGDVYCGIASAAQMIKSDAARLINVRQGYARCSVCAPNEHFIITADPSIAAAAGRNGVEVLLIEAGHIKLKGCGYGFIGGASAIIGSSVCFFGDLYSHPEGGKIACELEKHGYDILCLSREMMTDYGGAVVIE